MANTGNMLSTAVSGLQAFQRNLATIGHNISNVNTEGYSRQTVEMATRDAGVNGFGFIGNGVDVTSITRVYDQFLFDQMTARNSSFNQLDTLQTLASGIDELLSDEDAGLNPIIQRFFNAVQDVANNPTSIPSRQVLLSDAQTLANQFQALDYRFSSLLDSTNVQLDAITKEVSSLAESIAQINQGIVIATGQAGGQPPNDLLDKRDAFVNQLSELVSVSTNHAEDGTLSVFIGSGQPLVLGVEANSLSLVPNEYDKSQMDVMFNGATSSFNIGNQLSGGKLGGLLSFRDDIVMPAQNALGRVAIGLSSTFNAQHQLGDDINGVAGGLFFNDIVNTSPTALASSNNNPASGTVSVAINNTNALQASDYRLDYDGVTFSFVRLSDNTVVDSGFTVADFPRAIASEGISLSLAGGVAAGDSFLVRPVRQGANDIGVAISSAAEIAAAGSGNALGDNSNALALAGLQQQNVLGGGTETYQSAYASLVATVGVSTREAKVNANAQHTLYKRAVESHQSLSAVNLDEEAADLVKFQQAYQAAAQVIRVSDEVFQTLLNVAS